MTKKGEQNDKIKGRIKDCGDNVFTFNAFHEVGSLLFKS